MTGGTTSSTTPLALGILAGPGAWGYPEPERRWYVAEGGMAAAAAVVVGSFITDLSELDAALLPQVLLAAGATAGFAAWAALGSDRFAANRAPSLRGLAAARTVAMASTVVCWSAVARDSQTFHLWPLGAFVGFEAYLTLATLVDEVRSFDLAKQLAVSAVSIGAAVGCALLATPAFPSIGGIEALQLYLGLAVTAAAGHLALGGASVAERRAAQEAARNRRLGQAAELAARADWLHNEVIGAINPVRQAALASPDPEVQDVGQLLDRTIHDWRQTQLALAIASRPVRFAEIVSHMSRTYRRLGLTIEAPGAEAGQLILEGLEAELAHETLAITMSNAANAGAERITIQTYLVPHGDASDLCLIVEDDGAGFDPSTRPAGRGLDRLEHRLGRPLRISSGATGTRVEAVVARRSHG